MKYLTLLVTALLVCSCSSAPPPPRSFSVNLKAPSYKLGEAEAYVTNIVSFGAMKKMPINLLYYPDDDAVCLQFRYEFTDCNQFWDRAGREAFVGALQTYQDEFDQRKLTNNNRRNRSAYGTVQGFFAWKRTRISAQATDSTNVGLGYQFRSKAVFFSTAQSEASFKDSEESRTINTQGGLTMHFTREQAGTLAAFFNQELLQGIERPAAGTRADSMLDSY